LDAYINHFGYTAADGSKYISADWQAGINNASKGGQIFGLLINGWAQSKYGSRKTYMVGMVVMTLTSESSSYESDRFEADESLHLGIRCQSTHAARRQYVSLPINSRS